MTNVIEITSGSDATIQFAFADGAAPPVALAITNPTVIEAGGGLAGRCTASLTDGPNGLAEVFIEGTDPIALGTHYLRLQATLSDSNSLASARLLVHVV